MPVTSRQFHLIERPLGEATPANFRLVETRLSDPRDGEVLVRSIAMSVDPYMRLLMGPGPTYAPVWELDRPMRGATIGEVVASATDGLPVGTIVLHDSGWRDFALLSADHVAVAPRRDEVPLSYHLGVLGMPGLTAWAGLFDVAAFREGETLFVSGAAGAVGGLAGQFARLRGARRVIGSAGSPEKVRHLIEDLGFDAAFDYHDGPVADLLRAAAPDGIDVYFDNVGGEHLEAALAALVLHGRGALCGAVSGYNAAPGVAGPRNLFLMVAKRLALRGFLVDDHEGSRAEYESTVCAWLRSGELIVRETVVDGLENAVEAFLGMMGGANIGKMVVRIAPDPVPPDGCGGS